MARYSIEAVRRAVSLEALISRDLSWDMRKTNASRGDYWACCPFHGEATPSFHVREQTVGEGRFHCFGCGENGSIFDYVMARDGCEFGDALVTLAQFGGVAPDATPPRKLDAETQGRIEEEGAGAYNRGIRKDTSPYPWRDPDGAAWRKGWAKAEDCDRRERFKQSAGRIWRGADPDHPLIGDYIAARIGRDRQRALWYLFDGPPPVLRLAINCPYHDAEDYKKRPLHIGPALIGLVARGGAFVGVHRTWISPDGSGRIKRLSKRMLGDTYGGSIVFGPPSSQMIVGEGIETVLAELGRLAMLGMARDVVSPSAVGGWTAECALSRNAISGRAHRQFGDRGTARPSAVPDYDGPGWRAPDACDELVILGDGDSKRPDNARAIMACAQRRHARRDDGRTRSVRIDWAGGDVTLGLDHADVAKREAVNV